MNPRQIITVGSFILFSTQAGFATPPGAGPETSSKEPLTKTKLRFEVKDGEINVSPHDLGLELGYFEANKDKGLVIGAVAGKRYYIGDESIESGENCYWTIKGCKDGNKLQVNDTYYGFIIDPKLKTELHLDAADKSRAMSRFKVEANLVSAFGLSGKKSEAKATKAGRAYNEVYAIASERPHLTYNVNLGRTGYRYKIDDVNNDHENGFYVKAAQAQLQKGMTINDLPASFFMGLTAGEVFVPVVGKTRLAGEESKYGLSPIEVLLGFSLQPTEDFEIKLSGNYALKTLPNIQSNPLSHRVSGRLDVGVRRPDFSVTAFADVERRIDFVDGDESNNDLKTTAGVAATF